MLLSTCTHGYLSSGRHWRARCGLVGPAPERVGDAGGFAAIVRARKLARRDARRPLAGRRRSLLNWSIAGLRLTLTHQGIVVSQRSWPNFSQINQKFAHVQRWHAGCFHAVMPIDRCHFALLLSASFATLVAVWLPRNRADACSIACAAGTLLPSGGDIPSDQVRFRYAPPRGKLVDRIDGGAALPRLYQLEGPALMEVPLRVESSSYDEVWLAPEQPLPEGTQLVLEAPSCAAVPLRGEYRITAAAPSPGELGTLQASLHRDVLRVAVTNGSCSLPADVSYADLSVKLSGSALPYAAVFDYAVLVDGKQHPEFSRALAAPSPLPHGEARIYATCRADTYFRSDAALMPGLHRVRMTAKVGDKTLQTPEIEVDLSCTGSAPAWEPDSDLPRETPLRADDAGNVAQTERDALSPSKSEDDGCSLRVDGSTQSPAWLALTALALTLRRRRRAP